MTAIGDLVWIPCEVKPGAFYNERLVRLKSPAPDEWLGFVQIYSLQTNIDRGENSVKAQVVDINCDFLTAKIFGEPLTNKAFYQELIERTTPIDTL